MQLHTIFGSVRPWSAASWRMRIAPGAASPLSEKFAPSCFIWLMIEVYALCGSRFDSDGVSVTVMPACSAALMDTSVDRVASGESLVRITGPCNFAFFATKYVYCPCCTRYVCGTLPTVAQSIIAGVTG